MFKGKLGAMFKGMQIVYALIAAVVVTVLTGAENLRRIDRLAQDALFQQPGVTSSDIVIIGIDEEALADLGPECHGVRAGGTGRGSGQEAGRHGR